MHLKLVLLVNMLLSINHLVAVKNKYVHASDDTVNTCLKFKAECAACIKPIKPSYNYFEVGIGFPVWYQAQQLQFSNVDCPWHASAEYGNSTKILSYFADLSILSRYSVNSFILSPTIFSINLKYSVAKKLRSGMPDFDVFGIAGPSIAYAKISQTDYNGIMNYNHKTEDDFSFGYNLGGGTSYSYKHLKLSAFYLFSSNHGNFYSGGFEKKRVAIGAKQIILHLSYTFQYRKNKYYCPSY